MADSTRRPRGKVEISPPPGFRCAALDADSTSDEVVVMSYELPEWELPDTLTTAEKQVLREILNGATQAAVAEARGVSSATVANQLASIFAKLGARSRLELAIRLRRPNSEER